MWEYIIQLTQKLLLTKIMITETMVLFGIESNSMRNLDKQQAHTFNHIILIAKMCISKYRYGTPINFIVMLEKETLIRKFVV